MKHKFDFWLEIENQIREKDADNNTILTCVIFNRTESVELGVIPIQSVISEIPIMQTSKTIPTLIVATPMKALKHFISKNKVGGRLKV